MPLDLKVALLAILNALLITAGTGFQKLNGVRGGDPVKSLLLLVAFICFAPTFFLANLVYKIGGRMTLFVAVSAVNFVLIALLGRWAFDEALPPRAVMGIGLIVAGVSLVATAGGPR